LSGLLGKGLSPDVLNLVLNSWTESTKNQYNPYIKRWLNYCGEKRIDPMNATVQVGAEFLAKLFKENTIGYSAINTARSALSAIITPINGIPLGRQPLIQRLMRGVFKQRPSYQSTLSHLM